MQKHRGILQLNRPVRAGVIEDWDDMELLWRYLLDSDHLNIAPRENNVRLLSRPLFHDKTHSA